MNLFVQSIFKSVLFSILILSCTERPVDAYVAYSEILKMHRKEVEFVDSESGVREATIADFNNAGWYEVNGFSGNSFVGLNYDSINEEAYAGAKFGNIATSVEDVISGGDGEMVEDKFPLEFENDPGVFRNLDDPEEPLRYGIYFSGNSSEKGTKNYMVNLGVDLTDSTLYINIYNRKAGYSLGTSFQFRDYELMRSRFDRIVKAVKAIQ